MHRIPMAFLAACILLAGCGPTPPRKVKVSGTVKFEGKPVSSGNITFAPLGGGVPEVANIVSGMYEADITVGKKKVEIRAFRPGKAPPKDMAGPGGEGANIVENYIPSKYNDESTEAREVTASGPNTLDFDLKK